MANTVRSSWPFNRSWRWAIAQFALIFHHREEVKYLVVDVDILCVVVAKSVSVSLCILSELKSSPAAVVGIGLVRAKIVSRMCQPMDLVLFASNAWFHQIVSVASVAAPFSVYFAIGVLPQDRRERLELGRRIKLARTPELRRSK
jgi:hypothetical protein